MKNKLLTLLLAIFTCNGIVLAQPYCDVHTFTLRDGLPAGNISRIIQTDNGLMWFSTWNGLCCYDGYRFTTFRNQPGVNEIFTTNRIFLIKPSSTGDIWCCTYDRHVYLFDTRQCRFINVSEIISRKYGNAIVARNIYSLPNGHTWIVSNDSGPNYRINDIDVKHGNGIEQYGGGSSGHGSVGVKKIELDDSGREWIFSDKGVMLFDGKFDCDIPFEYIGQLGKSVMFASVDGKVYVYTGRDRPRQITMPAGVNVINGMTKLSDTQMLFATNIGVVRYDISLNALYTYSVQTPGQPSTMVKEVFVDHKQRIWAYTDSDGAVMIDTRSNDGNMSVRWLTAQADDALRQTTCSKPFFHEDKYGTVWIVPSGGDIRLLRRNLKTAEAMRADV